MSNRRGAGRPRGDRHGGRFPHVFINERTGRPYTTIMKVWSRLRKKAGLAHVRIHDLRHKYASFLVNAGHSLYDMQKILGHSDPAVTQRYGHLSSAAQSAANSASRAIRGAATKEPVREAAAQCLCQDDQCVPPEMNDWRF